MDANVIMANSWLVIKILPACLRASLEASSNYQLFSEAESNIWSELNKADCSLAFREEYSIVPRRVLATSPL